MDLKEYQSKCLNTWHGTNRLIRAYLGVCGEAGEMAENIKKYLREDYGTEELAERTRKEIGDVLYYLAVCAHELGFDLDDIARENIAKLAKRQEEGKIKGDGSER